MSTARKILSNTFAQVLGKVITAVLGLAVVKIGTNYLAVAGYGEYVLVYEFLAFFGIAADLGLFTIAVKEMSENEDDIPKIIGNVLSIRTILVFITMIVAVVTVFNIPSYVDTMVPVGVAIASFTVIFTMLNGTLTSVLQAKLQMGRATVATVIGKILSVGLMFYIAFYGYPNNSSIGFYFLLLAGVIGNIVMFGMTAYFVRKVTPIRYRFDIDFWKMLLRKSLPLGIALILNSIYFRIDSILISLMRGQTEVGIYGVGMKVLEHISIIPLYFMNSVLPVLTKAIKEKGEKYKKIISYSFDFLAALSVPIVVGAVILAYPLVFAIASPEFLSRLSEGFYGSDIALQILIFALFFQFLNVLFGFILIALDRQIKLLYINASGVFFNIVANLILIPHFGFRGAAFTSVLSEMFILIANYSYAKKYLDFKLNGINLIKIVFSALIMGGAIKLLYSTSYNVFQNWNLLILVPFGAVVYAVMLFVTGVVDKEMLALVVKRKG